MIGPLLLRAATDVLVLICFRALPMVGYTLCSRQVSLGARIALGVGFASVLLAITLVVPGAFADLALPYAYLIGMCSLMPSVASALRAGRIGPIGAFLVSSVAMFALPLILWRGELRATIAVVCWDLVLKAHSYCVEVAKRERAPELGATLFFLLVDPVLVYPQRGAQVAPLAWSRAGLARLARGAALVFCGAAVLAPLSSAVSALVIGQPLSAWTAVRAALRFLLEYARHAGLAGIQIGLMRQLGYALPERYLAPLSATSLSDFWRRWNTYVGQWVLRYLFVPLGQRFGRRMSGERMRKVAIGGGLLISFVVTGLLHDAYTFGLTAELDTTMLQVFTTNGALLLLWLAVARAFADYAVRNHLGPRWHSMGQIFARASLWVVALSCIAVWWP